MSVGVIDVLRRFLPRLGAEDCPRDQARRRAVWAITSCRTEVMGGHVHGCARCGTRHYAYHSCNHRSCPQCGRAATKEWVERELGKRIAAPYFMVTFTLPTELRALFFGEGAKAAFDLFFAASSAALRKGLAARRGQDPHKWIYRRSAYMEPAPPPAHSHPLSGAGRRTRCCRSLRHREERELPGAVADSATRLQAALWRSVSSLGKRSTRSSGAKSGVCISDRLEPGRTPSNILEPISREPRSAITGSIDDPK